MADSSVTNMSTGDDFPRERLSPVSTAVGTAAIGEKPKREGAWKTFRSMPILVKISAIWLIWIGRARRH